MCMECRQYPCHPRCPNAEERLVCHCDFCNAEIYEGTDMYDIDGTYICEDCVSRGKTTAILEEDDYYD